MKDRLKPALAACLVALSACLPMVACSSAPKAKAVTLEKQNQAAEFSALADGYLAKGEYWSAITYYDQALMANRSVDNTRGVVVSRNSLGRAFMALGNREDAEREFSDALDSARLIGDDALVALCLSNQGETAFARGDVATAAEKFGQAEPLALKDEKIAAIIAHNRGVMASGSGDTAAARTYLGKSAAANLKAKRWTELAADYYMLALAANKDGDAKAAADWLAKALDADKSAENTIGISADLEALGKVHRKLGDAELALDYYARAFGAFLTLADRKAETRRCLVALVELSGETKREDLRARYAIMLEKLGD